VSTARRGDRQSTKGKQRGRSRPQKRLDKSSAQGDEETSLKEVYDGQLDDVLSEYSRSCSVTITKCKPPTGCTWRVERTATSITVAAVGGDGETQLQVAGEYCDAKIGMWRDPHVVAERLAQVVLFGKTFEKISTFKGNVKDVRSTVTGDLT
jgi:hypothetical protein